MPILAAATCWLHFAEMMLQAGSMRVGMRLPTRFASALEYGLRAVRIVQPKDGSLYVTGRRTRIRRMPQVSFHFRRPCRRVFPQASHSLSHPETSRCCSREDFRECSPQRLSRGEASPPAGGRRPGRPSRTTPPSVVGIAVKEDFSTVECQ